MMKKHVLPVVLAVLMVLTMAVGCTKKGQTKNLTDAPLTGEVVADFSNGMPETMFASDGWCNGNPFNVYWKSNCVTFSDGEMHLAIKDGGDGWEYYGGELRSNRWYGYGDYEVCMKPAKVTGTASTFFTCTGPYDTGLDGNPHRHDEIDIEFLGKNTTGVQFNYFVDGKGGHEYWYDLGFDASEEYHTYGFRWEENAITWFVDGTPVYKVEREAGEPFPEMPGRILCNYWSGTIEAIAWMGAYSQNDTTADYKWVKTTADSVDLNPKPAETTEATQGDAAEEATEAAQAVEIDWSQIDAVVPAFESSNGKHTITVDGTAANIVYADAVCDWSNISLSVPREAAETDTLHLVVKNNGASDTNKYRIDVLENGKCINRSATWDGNPIFTDLEWGGSFLDNVPAGAEAEVVIRYAGTPDSVVIMLDTMHQGDDTVYSGDVTISEVKFASSGAADAQPEQEQSEQPEEQSEQPAEEAADPTASVVINGQAVSFTQEGDPKAYDVTYDPETNSVRAVYTDVPGNSYKNLYANLQNANENNTFTANVTNNGQNPLKLRVDMVSQTQVANATAANTYAEQDGAEVYTDLEWGGSMFTVQPGETAAIRVEYDPQRNVTGILFYLDSATYDDPELHSGDVTISVPALSNEDSHAAAAEEAPADEENEQQNNGQNNNRNNGNNNGNNQNENQNQNQNNGLLINGSSVRFTQDGSAYNVSYNNGLNVSYDGLAGASYKTLYGDVSEFVGDNNTLETTVTNNGTEPITIRIDVESNTHVNETNAANTSATQNGNEVYTDTTYGGSTFVIQPGETANLKVLFDATRGAKGVNLYFDSATWGDEGVHSGNITVSGMSFSKTEAQGNENQGNENQGNENQGNENQGNENQGNENQNNAANGASINGNEVALTGSDAYTVSYGDSTTVSYNELGGNSYSTLYGDCSEFIGDSNTFSTTVTNNGTEPVTIRIDIASNTTVNNTEAANISATQDGNGVYTDTTWGGSTFTIQPGESANLQILFDAARQAKGVTMYFDSCTWDDAGTHTGSVTISGMTFSTTPQA